jgi:hypothetical protein
MMRDGMAVDTREFSDGDTLSAYVAVRPYPHKTFGRYESRPRRGVYTDV